MRILLAVICMLIADFAYSQTVPRLLIETSNEIVTPGVAIKRYSNGNYTIRQERTPRNVIGGPDELKTTMNEKFKIPLEQFTDDYRKADYILRINETHEAFGSCRWSVHYINRIKDEIPEEIFIKAKQVWACKSAIKDVVKTYQADWETRKPIEPR
jgi:hypothetical protein